MSDNLTVFQLPAKWRSGERSEELREAWNKHNGPDADIAGGSLDGMLDCADELEAALAPLAELVRKVKGMEAAMRSAASAGKDAGYRATVPAEGIADNLAAALKEAGVE